MRLRKKYQNGGGVPGGDPKREAEQLAFAQLLKDEAFKKKLEEKMRLRDEYGVYAGTLPKIKNVRGLDVTLRDVNMPAHRGNVADITVGDIELASMSRNEDVLVQGRPMYEPDINAGASKLAESKDRLAYLKKNDPTSSEIPTLEKSLINRLGKYPEEVADMSAGSIRRAMADATKEMLDHSYWSKDWSHVILYRLLPYCIAAMG